MEPRTRRVAWAVTAAVAVGYATNSVIAVVAGGLRGAGLLAFLGCLAVVVSLQLAHYSQGALGWPARVRFLTLALQAVATFAPAAWVGPQFGAAAGFLAGSTLVVIKGGVRWVLYPAVGAAVLVAALLQGQPWEPLNLIYAVHFTLLTGLMLYAVGSLSTIAAELHDSRTDLVRMAVVQERLRVARDLHDLVGHDLSAITLRYELAYRLLPAARARALEEMRHALDVVRQATVGAQSVTGGYGKMSLAKERTDAAATLSAAQIEAGIRIPDVTLTGRLDEVMAIVLREGITNVLRHSKAQHCDVELAVENGTVRLHVANDGVDAVHADLTDRGDGLGNLTARLAEIGGRLTARGEGHWFHLTAEAPLRHQSAPPDRHPQDASPRGGWRQGGRSRGPVGPEDGSLDRRRGAGRLRARHPAQHRLDVPGHGGRAGRRGLLGGHAGDAGAAHLRHAAHAPGALGRAGGGGRRRLPAAGLAARPVGRHGRVRGGGRAARGVRQGPLDPVRRPGRRRADAGGAGRDEHQHGRLAHHLDAAHRPRRVRRELAAHHGGRDACRARRAGGRRRRTGTAAHGTRAERGAGGRPVAGGAQGRAGVPPDEHVPLPGAHGAGADP
ncbi:sensor histidine kinase [Nonomuraea salmonea]|uniref:sensor histidine kinase n=1 Tax=Nonomuraea salmonea TaxID=46181 RepID=UPI0031E5DC25